MPPIVCATSIHKIFPTRSGSLDILCEVSLTLEAGRAVAVMGPSGSGKSTLLNILGTLEAPTAGSVTIDGTNPFELPERDLARFRNQRIGFVFQEHHLLPQLSVLENVLLPTLADGSNADGLVRARELIGRVGLSDRLDHRPAELSGGERQRVAIARALINRPVLLLADEPTGNLDRTTSSSVADLIAEVQRGEGVAMVIVTHSEKLAERFAMRRELNEGRLVEA